MIDTAAVCAQRSSGTGKPAAQRVSKQAAVVIARHLYQGGMNAGFEGDDVKRVQCIIYNDIQAVNGCKRWIGAWLAIIKYGGQPVARHQFQFTVQQRAQCLEIQHVISGQDRHQQALSINQDNGPHQLMHRQFAGVRGL